MPIKKRVRLSKFSPMERILIRTNIDESSGCWNFTGAKSKAGYGQLRADGKLLYAHRVVYEFYHGAFGSLHILHRCDNPACCNPSHLFTGTAADNMRDMTAKGRNKGLALMNGVKSRWESVRASSV